MFRLKNALTVLVVAAVCATTMPSKALAVTKDADWIVTVQTEELQGMMDFKGSKHKDPVKVHVTYLDTQLNEDQKINYEDFWYNADGQLIGQEKHHKYDIRAAEQIIIKIKHKKLPPENKEYQAAADAALRFYLDACLHKGKVTAFRVPLDSFNGVEQAFEKLDYSPFEVLPEQVPGVQKIILYLASEPDGQTKYLRYNR